MKTSISTINRSYLLQQKFVVANPSKEGVLSIERLGTILKNLSTLGYTLSPSLVEVLSDENVEENYNSIFSLLSSILGADKKWVPMYPNFPHQVMEASDAELYVNAIMHYLGSALGMNILPQYEVEEREDAPKIHDLKVIELGSLEDYARSMEPVFNSKVAYSPMQREQITDLYNFAGKYVAEALPCEFINKENMCFVTGMLLKNPVMRDHVGVYVKTATDILRIAVSMSEGDISLATNTHFKKFSNGERKFLMGLLEKVNSPLEDMKRHRSKWLRLGEILHPMSYKNRFPRVRTAFIVLRNRENTIKTFNSEIERLIIENPLQASRKLMERPGEFARRLNKLLMSTSSFEIVQNFMEVVDKIPDSLLLELQTYFTHRNEPKGKNSLRVFFPKGQTSKAQCAKDERPDIDSTSIALLLTGIEKSLIDRYAKLDPLGKVYLDPELAQHNIPFGIRSASKSLKTLARGSRVSMNLEADTIRFFCWWKNGPGRVDVDLSAAIYNDNWTFNQHLSYTSLRGRGINACHSGDITDAPNGACEFIDIDVDSVVKAGARYVVMNVYSYTGQKFSEMSEASAGWMGRKAPDSGEIFDARTVEQKFDLTSEMRVAVPMILDCVERTVIWADMGLKSNNMHGGNNLESNLTGVSLLGKSITDMHKPTMYDLLHLHVQARGTLVDSADEADEVFNVASGITPEQYPVME